MKIRTRNRLLGAFAAVAIVGAMVGAGALAERDGEVLDGGLKLRGNYALTAFAEDTTSLATAKKIEVAGEPVDVTETMVLDSTDSAYKLCVTAIDVDDLEGLNGTTVGYSYGDDKYNGFDKGLSEKVYSKLIIKTSETTTKPVWPADMKGVTADFKTPKFVIAEFQPGDTTGEATLEINVPFAIGSGNVDLTNMNNVNHEIVINGAVADYKAGNWSGSAILNIGEFASNKNMVLEFTVKNKTNSEAGWPTDEWASQRFAIQAVKGNRGFLFFEPKGECNIFDMTNASFKDEEKTKLNRIDWIGTSLRSTDGATFRIVRAGGKLVLSVKDSSNAWVEIGSIDCGDVENEIIFYACGVTYECSGFDMTLLTHVEEKAPSATEDGNYEYYYTGADENKVYYDKNGKLTTWDNIKRDQVISTLAVTIKIKKNGVTEDFTGTFVNVNGTETALENGKLTLTGVEPGTAYEITSGDYAGKLVVQENVTEVELILNYEITIPGKDRNDNNWTGSAVLNLGELGTDIVFETHIKMSNIEEGWTVHSTEQRYAIRMTESGKGFYFWSWKQDGVSKTALRPIGNINDCMSESGGDELVNEVTIGWIYDELVSAAGADFRLVRIGATLNLYVKHSGTWEYVASGTCGAKDKTEIAVYGVTAEYIFSDFTVMALTHVEEKAPSATEDGNYEYYYTGADKNKVYYDKNGKLTTWDKIERPKFDMWDSANLTLSGFNIAEGTQIVLSYDIREITTTVGANGVVTLAGENALTKNVYKVVVGDYCFDVDFTTVNSVTKTLAQIKHVDFTAKNTVKTIDMSAAADSSDYTVTFNLKAVPGTDTWRYRFALLLINGDDNTVTGIGSIVIHEGNLMVWSAKGESPNDPADHTKKNDEKSLKFGELVKGADGVNIKVVRNGSSVTMSFELDGEWVELWTATLGDGQANLKFSCNNDVDWTVSNLAIDYIVTETI